VFTKDSETPPEPTDCPLQDGTFQEVDTGGNSLTWGPRQREGFQVLTDTTGTPFNYARSFARKRTLHGPTQAMDPAVSACPPQPTLRPDYGPRHTPTTLLALTNDCAP
jgi:hypothetical protein